jgi:flagellar motor protein MotB
VRGRTWSGAIAALLFLAGCPHGSSYPDGAGLEGQLDREIFALKQQIRTLQAQIDNCGEIAVPGRILADLTQVYAGTEVSVTRQRASVVVTMPADHLFRPGTVEVREEASMTLDLLATSLNLHPDHTAVIEGHTDDSPPTGDLARRYRDNWSLSFARADTVRDQLVRVYGVPEPRFSVVARGEFQPITSNDTASGQARNRRVVVYIQGPGVTR